MILHDLCNQTITRKQRLIKRVFDLFLAIPILFILIIPMIIFILFSTISTGSFGLFRQERIGRYGKTFKILKIRSMRSNDVNYSPISVFNREYITPFGRFLRKFNIDEWPQVINVVLGDMSMVGPRPDVSGYADLLEGENRRVLCVKPGITGPATIDFRNEEQLLIKQDNPKEYNDQVIWPKKVELNKRYIENWSIRMDIKYLFKTLK
ncbi:sugar transferase [Namhaeicola litoreus]|uniref:Sugar transferase n=1 Tax=Namhaeicola litoreus TaxID=1052145 RepID=A0ABW3Y7D8_9FLAO